MQLEGWFLFRYRMFDLFSVNDGPQPILAECWGRPFRIYATKQFPGLEPSTELTKVTNDWDSYRIGSAGGVTHLFSQQLYYHHVPIRARELRRKRKRSPNNDSSADADQSATP